MDLTQDSDGKLLYITHLKGLELFYLDTNTSTDILSESTYFADHAMMYDSNIKTLAGIIILQNNFMIVANYGCNMLYLVDLTTNSTSTKICTGEAGYRSGNASFCQVNQPWSLLQLDGDIYVGQYRAISVLKGMLISKVGQIIPAKQNLG